MARLFTAAGMPPTSVLPFGSAVARLQAEEGCDIDVCVVCEPHPVDADTAAASLGAAATNATHRASLFATSAGRRQLEQAALKRVAELLTEDPLVSDDMSVILDAKVPIIKCVVQLPEAVGVDVDLCVNRPEGAINSRLMLLLGDRHPVFRDLVRLLKRCAL
jgi:hypothetical protein